MSVQPQTSLSPIKTVALMHTESHYPTPIGSPVHLSVDQFSTTSLPLHLPFAADIITNSFKRNRKNIPSKAIGADVEKKGIVRLDFYEIYSALPKVLLYRKRSRSISYSSEGKRLKLDSYPPAAALYSNPSSVLTARAVNQMPVDESIDFSQYMNTENAPAIEKKGTPLTITSDLECYDELTPEELKTCATLRMYPAQYMHVKKTMITAVHSRDFFNKRDAQVWFKMDVNKTCLLYDWFKSVGWIPSKENWRSY